MDRVSCLIACGAIFAIMLGCASAQTVHIVGDGIGWDIPPNSSVSYANWASGRSFVVGDILVFNFLTNSHDVLQVPQASYTACIQDNAIGGIITNGPANITLDSAGDHHYICTIGRHCLAGQRLAITVSATPGGATPPMTTPPTTPPITHYRSIYTRTGPFRPDSGSTSMATSLLLILVCVGMALIF